MRVCLVVSLGTSAAIEQHLEWFGTFRGRAGVLVTPSTLLYATGGAAYGSLSTDITVTTITPLGLPVSVDRLRLEQQVRLDHRRRHRVDVRHQLERQARVSLHGSRHGHSTTGIGIGVHRRRTNLTTRVTDNIFRAGINYHFSAGAGGRALLR